MITLRNLSLRRGTKLVLDRASVTLNPGERVGLVGRNGAGKSSLFALFAGRLQADGGDFEMPPRWRLGEVAQHMPEVDTPATAFALEGDSRLMEAQAELEQAEADNDGEAMAHAHLALADAGAFDARARAQALLLGLGFKPEQLDAPVNSFSGGWRMRLQLARALMCPADLMLLDEPTNHLDLDALVWLEGWLKRYPGTLIVISHDREFLDAVTTVTLHLDEARLDRYGGNYTAFEEMRAERLEQQASAYSRQQDRIAHLQRFIDRFKAKATKAKQAQSRVKALARMEKLAPVLMASDFNFEFREPGSLPNPMLSMRDVACGYRVAPAGSDDASSGRREPGGEAPAGERAGEPALERLIVQGISRSVLAGQRIGILGANGQGKSTVVKTIAKAQPPLAGALTEGKGLAIGYFAQQEMDLLAADDAPLQHMVRLARTSGPDGTEQELRNFLGQFRFVDSMVHQTIGTLSGGEKARLVLASLVWQRPNLLLLDEPTNHLDLTTREALSMALNEFEGTVLLVSHDRALLREVCDEFWLVADGRLEPFDGDLDDYQRWLLERSREAARALRSAAAPVAAAAAAAPSPASAPPAPAPAPARPVDRKAAAQARARLADRTRPLRRELESLDARMASLGQEREALEAGLGRADLDPAGMAEHGRRLKQIADELEGAEERWLALQDEIETLGAQAAEG